LLKDAGYSLNVDYLLAAGYTLKDMRLAGFTAKDMKKGGKDEAQVQLKKAGWSSTELRHAGFKGLTSVTEVLEQTPNVSAKKAERDGLHRAGVVQRGCVRISEAKPSWLDEVVAFQP